ncbi:UNVERIFIED_CONTAM: hypothetical protein FKN15_060241 [Acipenser sinensis]
MEQQFGQSASKANFLIGVLNLPAVAIGIFIGGLLMKKYKLGVVAGAQLSFGTSFVSFLLLMTQFGIKCENSKSLPKQGEEKMESGTTAEQSECVKKGCRGATNTRPLLLKLADIAKAFFPSLKKLLCTPAYFLLLCGSILKFNSFIGLVTFKPKYMEQQFGQSASKANFLIGVLNLPAVAIGIFIGGLLMKKYKLGVVAGAQLSFGTSFVSFLLLMTQFGIKCENSKVFHNCSCVAFAAPPSGNISVILGQCPRKDDCRRSFIYYLAVSVIGSFISALGATPGYIVTISYNYETTISASTNSSTVSVPCSQDSGQLTELEAQEQSSRIVACEHDGGSLMWVAVLLGNMLRGVGEATITPLGISFIDDFASPENSAFYIGCLHTIAVIGPLFGFTLGAFCARMYVDIGFVDLGVTSMPAVSLGIFLSGIIMKKFKLDLLGAAKVALGTAILGCLCTLPLFALTCDNAEIAGLSVSYGGTGISDSESSVSVACNSGCGCPVNQWEPVCGENGMTYVSPCFAGCNISRGSGKNTTFHDCRCIEAFPKSGNFSAVLGQCPREEKCSRMFIYYLAFQSLSFFIFSLGSTPMYIINLSYKYESTISASTNSSTVSFPCSQDPGQLTELDAQEQSSRIAGCLHTITVIGPLFGFTLGSFCAKLYVDIGFVDLGVTSMPAVSLGIFFSGLIMKKFKLDLMGAAKMGLVTAIIGSLCILPYFALTCENAEIAGLTVSYGGCVDPELKSLSVGMYTLALRAFAPDERDGWQVARTGPGAALHPGRIRLVLLFNTWKTVHGAGE